MQKANHVNCIRLIWQFSPIYGVNLCIQSKYWKVWTRKKLLIWTLVTQCPCQFRFIEACLLCKTFCKTVVIQRYQVFRFFKGINGLIIMALLKISVLIEKGSTYYFSSPHPHVMIVQIVNMGSIISFWFYLVLEIIFKIFGIVSGL